MEAQRIVRHHKAMRVKDRIKGGFFGIAVGDALGVPVEFQSRQKLTENPITGYREFGTHRQPAGTWSDDTSLTLCLAESLTKGIDYADIGREFVAWLYEAKWTATDVVFDVGITTKQAIDSLKKGVQADLAGPMDEYSNGNGSLMRVLPIGLYALLQPLEVRRRLAFDISSITHGHPRAKIACWFYCEILRNIIQGNQKAAAVDNAWTTVNDWQASNGGNSQWPFFKLCTSKIEQKPLGSIQSTGYVIDSLEAAIYCLLTTDSFQDAVIKAVNLGEDTDTVGAITGGLAGTYYGFDAIPTAFIRGLKKTTEIEELVETFIHRIPYDTQQNLPAGLVPVT